MISFNCYLVWDFMAGLTRYVIYRVLLALPTLLILLTVVFFVLRVIPGNPIVAMVGVKAPPEYVEQLIKEAGQSPYFSLKTG